MSQFYDLEKASQILGLSTAEVNRLREQGKIQGFRDGATWKFKRDEVEKFLTQRIKTNSESGEFVAPSDDDFSLFEKDDDAPLTHDDDFFNLELDPGIMPAIPKQEKRDSDSERNQAATSVPSDDRKLDLDNELDMLSLVPDDDYALDVNGADMVSLIPDEESDELVLGGKTKPADSQVSTAESSSLSLGDTSGDSGLSLASEEVTSFDAPTEADDFALNLLEDSPQDPGRAEVAETIAQGPVEEVLTLDDLTEDATGGYAISSGDGDSYALADENSTESGSSFSLADDKPAESESSFSLADDEPAPAPEPKTSSSEIDLGDEEDDDGIFSLVDDPDVPKVSAEPAQMATENEDFQLDPDISMSDESDSESASQVIAVDDNVFLSEDDNDGPFGNAGGAGFAQPELDDDSLSSEAFAPLDDENGFPAVAPDDGFGDPMAAPLPSAESSPEELEIQEVSTSAQALPKINSEGCSYNAGKGCVREARFSGLEIMLLLLPLLVLIPGAFAVYELIRSVWSWEEPFTLSGTILETVANLVNLINK